MPRTQVVSGTHLVLIPSYNTGEKVVETVRDARSHWNPVWVVVDGSTDGTAEQLRERQPKTPGLRVFTLPRNQGKGAAVLHGLREAVAQGYTHALTMDADGQHPAARIPEIMAASEHAPEALILGKPVFDASAPRVRVIGRRVSNGWANLETLWAGIWDSLFGFRVYPIRPLLAVMEVQRWMRRFDFDVEAVVRLAWRGLPPINYPPRRAISAPRKAACRTSTTCATICCCLGCMRACSQSSCFGCPGLPGDGHARIVGPDLEALRVLG